MSKNAYSLVHMQKVIQIQIGWLETFCRLIISDNTMCIIKFWYTKLGKFKQSSKVTIVLLLGWVSFDLFVLAVLGIESRALYVLGKLRCIATLSFPFEGFASRLIHCQDQYF